MEHAQLDSDSVIRDGLQPGHLSLPELTELDDGLPWRLANRGHLGPPENLD